MAAKPQSYKQSSGRNPATKKEVKTCKTEQTLVMEARGLSPLRGPKNTRLTITVFNDMGTLALNAGKQCWRFILAMMS